MPAWLGGRVRDDKAAREKRLAIRAPRRCRAENRGATLKSEDARKCKSRCLTPIRKEHATGFGMTNVGNGAMVGRLGKRSAGRLTPRLHIPSIGPSDTLAMGRLEGAARVLAHSNGAPET
jgi:hypothetical protein